ncbi:MAG: FtsX-like permease family protein, partial [Erysipelotrichaceae bacterium]|nr:FtsX-like permease family protein [Erysipelotrichaceae bacterium]
EGSRFEDVYCGDEEVQLVTRFQELDVEVNKFELLSGRMPQKDNEALALNATNFSSQFDIGKTITILSDVSETLANSEYDIVGIVKSPQYMSGTKETSTLDNRTIDVVVYIPNRNFLSDYYKTVYMSVTGASDLESFSIRYNSYIDSLKEDMEIACLKQQEYYKETIRLKAQQKIDEGTQEFNRQKEEAEAKIAEAEQQLYDSNIKLLVYEAQIESNELTLKTSEQQLELNERLLKENKAKVDEGIRQLEKETGMSLDDAYNEISVTYYYYLTLEEQLGNSSQQISALQARKDALQAQIDERNAQIAQLKEQLEQTDPLDPQYVEIQTSIAELETEVSRLNGQITAIDMMMQNYNDDTIQQTLDELDAAANGSVKESYLQVKALYDARTQIEEAQKQLDDGRRQLEEGKKQLEEAKREIASGRRAYENGVKQLNENKKKMMIELENAENELKKAQQQIDELPNAKWTILDRSLQYTSYMYDTTIKQMRAICIAMPFLFFLVAALVCMTTMTRLIDEQRSQIGIFSALGFSDRQISGKYMTYSFIASSLGAVFGIPAGIAIFPPVVYFCWRLMYDLPDIHIYVPLYIAVLCALSFVVLMLGVTWLVCRKSLVEMPAQLMRPKAPKNARKTFIEYITFIWRRLSFTSKVTARNLIRYKSRFFMTVIGVAGSIGLLIVGFGVKDSIVDVVDVQYDTIFLFNNKVVLSSDVTLDDITDCLKADLDNQKIVTYKEYVSKVFYENKDDTITVQIFDPREITSVIDLRTRRGQQKLFLDTKGVIISEKYAENHKLTIGDYIEIASAGDIKAKVRISGICEMYAMHYLFMSDTLYEDVFGEKYHPDRIAVYTLNQKKLESDMEQFEDVVSVLDFTGEKQTFETMLSALDAIVAVIIMAAGALALVVIINLTEVNISERIREIATLKVLGFYDGEVDSYIFKEIMILTIIGAIAGMPLGKLEHYIIMNVIDVEMVKFGFTIKPLSYLMSFGITILFSLSVMLMERKSLKNVKMIESLKSVE